MKRLFQKRNRHRGQQQQQQQQGNDNNNNNNNNRPSKNNQEEGRFDDWRPVVAAATTTATTSVPQATNTTMPATETTTSNNNQKLWDAAENGKVDIVRQLLQQGNNINVNYTSGKYKSTPLHMASINGHLEIAQLLIDNGANVNANNSNNWTPLHYASYYGHLEIAQLLIDNGANVNAKNSSNYWTPLHNASYNGHLEIAQLLIDNGANVNAKSSLSNSTPLHWASNSGHLEIVKLLLRKGGDVEARNNKNKTPLQWAQESKHTNVVNALESHIHHVAQQRHRQDSAAATSPSKQPSPPAKELRSPSEQQNDEKDAAVVHIIGARHALLRAVFSQTVNAETSYIPFDYIKTIARNWNEPLGHGGFGTVYKAIDEEVCMAVAIKTIKSDTISDTAKGSFDDEILNMAHLSHPNIVRYYGYSIGQDKEGADIHCMVLQYAGGGSVASILGSDMNRCHFDPSKRLYVAESLVSALEYLHKNDIFHRDVKLENCCLEENWEDSPHLLLVDFGVAERIVNIDPDARDLTSAPGTELYMAPEYLSGANPRFTAKSEVYSVGVVLVALLTGDCLFLDLDAFNPRTCSVEGILGHLDMTAGSWRPASLAESLAKVAVQCLSNNEHERPSMTSLLGSLKHFRSQAGALELLPPARITAIRTHKAKSRPSTLRPVGQGTTCIGCKQSCTHGALCINGHLTCSDGTCLEELLRSQKGCKNYQCGATGCTKHFLLSDMFEIITMELYNELLQEEFKTDIVKDLSQTFQEQFRILAESVNVGFAGMQHGLAKVSQEVRSSRDVILADMSSVKDSGVNITEVNKTIVRMKQIAGDMDRREARLEKATTQMEERLLQQIHKLSLQFSSSVAQHVSGQLQCPRLFVMLPIRTQRWNLKRIVVAQEYQLYFLCAFDQSLVKTPITVKRVREWVTKSVPILKYVIFALKVLVTVYGVPVPKNLPDFIPGSTDEEKFGQALEEMKALLDEESLEDLEDWVSHCQVDTASLGPLLQAKCREIPVEAYTEVALRAYKPKNSGWLSKMQLVGKGSDFAWVKNENVEAWTKCH